MSRIIVKNIPTHLTQKQLSKHFANIDTVTDVKIMKNQEGKSRRFCFIGFKNVNSGKKAIKQYNQTFLGVSKISISQANVLSSSINENQNNHDNNKKELSNKSKSKNKNDKSQNDNQKQSKNDNNNNAVKKFNEFKKIVKEGIKKSWDDMLIPTNNQDEQDNNQEKNNKKLNKKQKKAKKIQQKQKEKQRMKAQKQHQQLEINSKSKSKHKNKTISQEIKAIKAPQLSQKNKKFVQKPLEVDSSRLYITNLPYQITQQQVKKIFSKYGNILKVKLPANQDGKTKGYCFITYSIQEEALRAFSKLDKTNVFGRIIHIKPSLQDIGEIIKNGKQVQHQKMIEQKYGNSVDQKTSFKKQKKKQMRNKLNDTTNWNTIFLNPNTVLERVSKKLGISKSEILASQNLAPKVALAQAQIINQTKQWMKSVGINLQFMALDRQLCQRNKKIILVKNLNHRTLEADLKTLFNYYGIVNRLLLAPNRAIALVQYQNQSFAQNAIEKLQNHKFKNNFLYLEYAPIGMLNQQKIEQIALQQEQANHNEEQLCKVVYIKNLSFNTSEKQLKQFFEKHNEKQKIKSVRIVYRGQKSMGYGFVEFNSAEVAQSNIKKLQNSILDGHKILLSMSQKKKQTIKKAEKLREKLNKQELTNNKLMVRNIAFEATKQELKDLFKQFGVVTKIRLPKKMNGQHRGFGFVEFQSLQDAGLAKQSLTGTHFYGRRLVIQYQSQKDK